MFSCVLCLNKWLQFLTFPADCRKWKVPKTTSEFVEREQRTERETQQFWRTTEDSDSCSTVCSHSVVGAKKPI